MKMNFRVLKMNVDSLIKIKNTDQNQMFIPGLWPGLSRLILENTFAAMDELCHRDSHNDKLAAHI